MDRRRTLINKLLIVHQKPMYVDLYPHGIPSPIDYAQRKESCECDSFPINSMGN